VIADDSFGDRLGVPFFDRDVREVARDLLGRILVVGCNEQAVAVRITETEAYGGPVPDPGSHAHRRRTPRNEVMFARAGFVYVYRSYGIHWCMNIVTGREGSAAAVLLRAGQVVLGLDLARSRRRQTNQGVTDPDLARGPGRLCAAAGVTGAMNRADLTLDPVNAVRAGRPMADARPGSAGLRIGVSTRTGVSGPGADLPYRYFLLDEPTVSPHRPVRPTPGPGA